jgi:hypothetical protein
MLNIRVLPFALLDQRGEIRDENLRGHFARILADISLIRGMGDRLRLDSTGRYSCSVLLQRIQCADGGKPEFSKLVERSYAV